MKISKRLCIKSNILLFADLVRGNADSVRKIVDLAKANECNFIGVPKAVKPETVQQLQEMVGSDAKVQPVNFTIPGKLLCSPASQPQRQQDEGFLHPKTCALLFARLANGDDDAATTIALRVVQNACKVVGVPSNLATQKVNELAAMLDNYGVEFKVIRFELSEGVLQKAFRDIQKEKLSSTPKQKHITKRKPSNKTGLQLDAEGRDAEGNRRKKRAKTDEEKAAEKARRAANKAARAAENRARAGGGSSKKD